MGKPTWENTLNADRRPGAGDLPRACRVAHAYGYPYVLFGGRVYAVAWDEAAGRRYYRGVRTAHAPADLCDVPRPFWEGPP